MLYEILLILGLALYVPRAVWRRRLPHRGWSMRLGRYPASVGQALQGRRALWVHAVSLGEARAAEPLLRGLAQQRPASPIVLSTITPSGFEAASTAVAGRGVAVFFPLDLRACVSRALSALQPSLLLLMESEIWPTVIRLTKARGVPVAIVNGRISPRAFRRYALAKPWLRGTLQRVDLFLMQSEADADRIVQLGAPRERVRIVGSLKWEASLQARPEPSVIQETAARLGLNGRQQLIVAGSTHRGEEGAFLDAFKTLRASREDLRLVVAPRHLERLAEVEALIRQSGFNARRLSSAAPEGRWEVGLVDAFGQLPRYYGLATVVFIGGSLVPHGGQNPLEASSLGKPVLFGPSMHNFAEIAQQLLTHRAARQLATGAELTPALESLLADPAELTAMGRNGQALTQRSQGALQRTLDAIRPLL